MATSRQERRKQAREGIVLQDKKRISRRTFFGIAGTLATAALSYSLYELVRPPTYEEALNNPQKRQKFAESLFTDLPDYAHIAYMPADLLRKLEQEGYEQPLYTLASTVPHERNPFRIGTESTIVLYDECFDKVYAASPEAWNDLELILQQVLHRHERLHAQHYHEGIPEYPSEHFRDSTGTFNETLFKTVSELLAHQEEYLGLLDVKTKGTSQLLPTYRSNMVMLMTPHYHNLRDPLVTKNMNPAFIRTLQRDLHPSKLLAQ